MRNPRVPEYESRNYCRLFEPLGLGPGQDGVVLRSDRLTAVKFFDRAERFAREREVYRILLAKRIYSCAGHSVPELKYEDEELLAIEMTIVQPPFVLDFA